MENKPILKVNNLKTYFYLALVRDKVNLFNLLAMKYGTVSYCYGPNMRAGSGGC